MFISYLIPYSVTFPHDYQMSLFHFQFKHYEYWREISTDQTKTDHCTNIDREQINKKMGEYDFWQIFLLKISMCSVHSMIHFISANCILLLWYLEDMCFLLICWKIGSTVEEQSERNLERPRKKPSCPPAGEHETMLQCKI